MMSQFLRPLTVASEPSGSLVEPETIGQELSLRQAARFIYPSARYIVKGGKRVKIDLTNFNLFLPFGQDKG
jgi:hypothetical protein